MALVTGSPIAVVALPVLAPWFDRRAARDERRLAERFGHYYVEYRNRVPRWLAKPPRSKATWSARQRRLV